MKRQLAVELLAHTEINQKATMRFSLATLACILVDLLCFCVQFRWFIEGQSDHTNLWMLVCTFAFLAYDVLPTLYLMTLRRTMPAHFNAWIWEALNGDSENLARQISQLLPNYDQAEFNKLVNSRIEQHNLEQEQLS